jgi:hypothetical protein
MVRVSRATRFRSLVGVWVVVATLLALAPSASAAGGTAGDGRTTTTVPKLWSFSAAFNVDSSDNELAHLIAARDTYCPPGKPIAVSMTLSQALASARQFVIAQAGAAAVSRFDHSATAQSAAQSRAAAVGMFVGRKPVPALLALLRTHQLVPRDPSILSSISAVLNILGLGKQSFVVARAADAMTAAPAPAMGISGQAMLLNNEANAMLLLRRWAAAELMLRQAVQLSPELAEAKVNLALALLCQHEDVEAARFYRLGQYRKPYDLVQLGTDPSGPFAPRADLVFDLSHGVNGTYPILRVPETWQETNGDTAIQQWNTAYQDFQNQLDIWHATQIRLHDQIDWAHIDPLVMRRYTSVMGTIYGSHLQPQFKPLYAAQQTASSALFDFLGGYGRNLDVLQKAKPTWPECIFPGGSTQACEARWQTECSSLNDSTQALWKPLIIEYDRASRAFDVPRYRFETGVLANLGDPLLRQYASVNQKIQWWWDYHDLIIQRAHWADWLKISQCNGSADAGDPRLSQPSINDPAPGCAKFLEGVKFSVKFGDFLKFSTNCEQIAFEVASKSAIVWLGGFAEGSFNFVKEEGTIFAGAKGGLKIPETGISVSAKEGIYLTVGSGGVKDVGIRVSTAASFGLAAGPTVDMKGFAYSLSFVSKATP